LFVTLADAADRHGDLSLFDAATQYNLYCVDGLERVAGNVDWEEKLFQLCNFARDYDRSVILTAERPPTHLGLALRDLVTRLMSGLTYQVLPLNDAQKISALQERAAHRGFELPTNAAQYLLDRCHRQTSHLFDILDTLDRASLEQKRVITVPFLRSLKLE
jgi:DnaA family protein